MYRTPGPMTSYPVSASTGDGSQLASRRGPALLIRASPAYHHATAATNAVAEHARETLDETCTEGYAPTAPLSP